MNSESLLYYLVALGIGLLLLWRVWQFIQGVREGYRKGKPRPQSSLQVRSPRPSRNIGATPAPATIKSSSEAQVSTTQSPADKPTVFVSYRREDSPDVAGRIYDRLVLSFGKDAVFKDVDSIPPGIDFRVQLREAVSRCDVVLTIVGPRWIGRDGNRATTRLEDPRDFVRIELLAALERNIPVVPVLVSGTEMPMESDLPKPLAPFAYRNAVQVRPDPDFHNDMDRLIKGIDSARATQVK